MEVIPFRDFECILVYVWRVSLSKLFHGFTDWLVLCTPVHGLEFLYAVLGFGGENSFEG